MKRQDVSFINEIPSVKINLKTGEGMKKLWKQMIQQFHKVSYYKVNKAVGYLRYDTCRTLRWKMLKSISNNEKGICSCNFHTMP